MEIGKKKNTNEMCIRDRDKEDIQYFKDIGLEFELEEHPNSKVKLFYEEYEV